MIDKLILGGSMEEFWCVTTFFNPARYKSLLKNHHIFAENLKRQGVNLLTVEMAFGDAEFEISTTHNVLQLRGNSIMWQKERLINYAVSNLPSQCKYFAWLDCDVLFSDDNWAESAVERLKKHQMVQLYKKVFYLPPGHTSYQGQHEVCAQSVFWQAMIHKNWLQRRINKELPFSTPGFAWGAQRSFFSDIGLYDKNIIGSGDTFIVDCCLNSWEIHGYAKKFNNAMKVDMARWQAEFNKKPLTIDYLPVDIYHLWHGSLKNRRYMDRHEIIAKYDYDPRNDIVLKNNVYEWNSEKPGLHEDIRQYFFDRQEDTSE